MGLVETGVEGDEAGRNVADVERTRVYGEWGVCVEGKKGVGKELGGGNEPGGAPTPGQSAPGGIYGPPDSYISFAFGQPINSILALVAGVAMGGALVIG